MLRAAVLSVIGAGLAAGLCSMSGCRGTTRAGSEYTILPNRELETTFRAPLEEVYEAAKAVINDLQYTITHDAIDARQGLVEALTATQDEVRVELEWESPEMTEVQVKVGTWGDSDRASDILSLIQEELNEE